jgi:hypothetical protein
MTMLTFPFFLLGDDSFYDFSTFGGERVDLSYFFCDDVWA